MALKRGTPIDQNLVEQVRILRSQGRSQLKVSEALGISVCTVRRYERREDETPEQEVARKQNLVLAVDRSWEMIRILEDQNLKKAKEGKYSLKDGVTSRAIEIDKIQVMENQLGRGDTTKEEAKILFVAEITGSPLQIEPDSGGVLQLEGEVPGDGVRLGGGEDLLGLPGSCEADPCSEDLRGYSREHLSEHEGLRPADDNGRTLDGSGDTGRVEGELPPVQQTRFNSDGN